MKRNITVNIFGSLYPMDEDAYALLNAYITDMRDYFSRQPDGKEIADDIEGRVAELMSELRQSGTEAISIEHIEGIINRVGKPEQLIEEESVTIEANEPPVTPKPPRKKLFRDPEHKVLGGVFGGLGCYLGVNPVWLRLAYILMIFGLCINLQDLLPIILLLVSAYFVCWASIPLASNPAERLQMKGEPVNLSNMCDEFLTSTKEMLSRQSQLNKDGRLASGVASVLKWCVYAVGISLVVACVAGVIGLLIAIVCAVAAPWGSIRDILGDDSAIVIMLDSNPTWLIWTAIVSLIVLLVFSLFLLAHFTLRILGSVRPLSTVLRSVCLAIWIIALLFAAASMTKLAGNCNVFYHQRILKDWRAKGGESMSERKEKQLGQLHKAGWEVTRDNNIRNYTNHGMHYTGNSNIIYLDAAMDESDFDMEYEAIREERVAPGIYRLEAKGRTNGKGAEIFAVNGYGQRYSAPIPVCGNQGGSVWRDARTALEADSLNTLPNRSYLEVISKANNARGYGWSDILIEGITVGPDSILRYGITNISPTNTWDGSWLSATSYELKKQEERVSPSE